MTSEFSFFRVRNFEKFQHYSDRRPPWIKLYRDLWDDPRFFDLSDSDRYLLIGLFVIASQHDNKVSANQKWLRTQLLTSRRIPLEKLIATGWLEPVEQIASESLADSNVLADRYLSRARGETETEIQNTETEIHIAPEEALASAPMRMGEFGWVLLTPEQHGKLKTKLNGTLGSYVDRFDRWVNEAPDAKVHGVRRRDRHAYESILNWYERDAAKGGNREYKTKTDRNAEAARQLLSRLDSQNGGSGLSGDLRSDPSGVFGAAPIVKRE